LSISHKKRPHIDSNAFLVSLKIKKNTTKFILFNEIKNLLKIGGAFSEN